MFIDHDQYVVLLPLNVGILKKFHDERKEIVKSESMPGSSALFTSKELTVFCTKGILFKKNWEKREHCVIQFYRPNWERSVATYVCLVIPNGNIAPVVGGQDPALQEGGILNESEINDDHTKQKLLN